jgi:hypothetical protein
MLSCAVEFYCVCSMYPMLCALQHGTHYLPLFSTAQKRCHGTGHALLSLLGDVPSSVPLPHNNHEIGHAPAYCVAMLCCLLTGTWTSWMLQVNSRLAAFSIQHCIT